MVRLWRSVDDCQRAAMIPPMTERGLPIVDGAPACPFVAFEDDRDARAGSPDHRHRCYAEVRPAPRALAHQEAYCLASAFAVCPTFQDWARREAARRRLPHDLLLRRPRKALRIGIGECRRAALADRRFELAVPGPPCSPAGIIAW